MALDGIVLNKIVNKLNEEVPLRINKIYSVGKTELLFNVRSNRTNKRLLISNDSNQNRVQLSNRGYDNDSEPTNFVMLLRKYLLNGIISEIKQYGYDRIVRITINNHNNIGDEVTYYLYLELLGRYSNTILCDSDDIIIDAIKRISPLESESKSIIPGAKYVNIANTSKVDFFSATQIDINSNLSQTYAGISPILSDEIKYRLINGESLTAVQNLISNSESLYICKKSQKMDYHVIPLTKAFESFSENNIFDALDEFYYDRSLNQRIKQETNDLLKFLKREIKKATKKISKLQNDLGTNQNYAQHLIKGDLLTTYMYEFKKGDSEVILIDYNTNEPVTIKLDEKLSPNDNAQKYYKMYRKQKKSLDHILEQIQIANDNIDYFSLLRDQLDFADIASAREIKQELINNKLLFEKRKYNKKVKNKPSYLEMYYNDVLIRVGRNNIQNDYLLKDANRNHYWFHINQYHGSHVIVCTTELTADLIEFAATLAVQYSQAKTANNVDVNYTKVRNVKRTKVKGLVNISEVSTVTIENDYELIKDYIK